MKKRFLRSALAIVATLSLVFGSLVGSAIAQDAATPEASPAATPVTTQREALDSTTSAVDLDVLVIGAHPDDEAFGLATYGQWNEFSDVQVGVITVTRGEGGGNAVGTEEGPALGVLREGEERQAVSYAGIEHIYNLDKVDFYYTVSAPLTEDTWGYEDTLERVVRVVRATTPEVIITMSPAPSPGNHGHHQVAARLAVDAYAQAGDPDVFPQQVTDEGFPAWSVSSIYQFTWEVQGQPGPDCQTQFTPVDPTDTVFGVWEGTVSEINDGRTWGEVARDGQRTYASQGWAGFPDAPTDPAEIGCTYFSLIDSRVPISANLSSTTAMLENALIADPSGLPLGTQLYLTADTFSVLPGQPFTVTAHGWVPEGADLTGGTFLLSVPPGWELANADEAPVIGDDGSVSQAFTVTPDQSAQTGVRYKLGATYSLNGALAATSEVVQMVAPVTAVLEPLPEIAQYQQWTADSNVPQLNSLIFPVTSIAVGATENVNVIVTNNSADAQSGDVGLQLPDGFAVDAESVSFDDLPAGESTTVTFAVTNTDTSLATANEGGENGAYPLVIGVTSDVSVSSQQAGINLVPSAEVPQASADAAVDGVIADGEYGGEPLDLSRVWEGEPPADAADASGTGWVTWGDDGLYVAVQVQDDVLGTVLTPEDAKRHWRTDSVEIAIDPLGTAPNTSATFKVGVFPTTTAGAPAAYRDADAHQGPVSETAPGFEVASTVNDPYNGYVIETFIPFENLPAEIDPQNAALNIFIYDSDTQDLTGQTRLGWSTYGGVQGDPYRWGKITLVGLDEEGTPVSGDAATPVAVSSAVDAPIMPLDAAQSAQSPQSIAQSAGDGVPLAGAPPVAEGDGLNFQRTPSVVNGQVPLAFEAASNGTAQFYVVDADGAVVAEGSTDVSIGATEYAVDGVSGGGELTLLVSFVTDDGKVQALSIPVDGGA